MPSDVTPAQTSTELVSIGEFCVVPCARYRRGSYLSARMGFGWIPVMLPVHTDPELGVEAGKHAHWHIDFRFVTPRQLALATKEMGGCHATFALRHGVYEGPKWIRRKCYREHAEFPIECLNERGVTIKSPFAAKLEDAYAGRQLNLNCMKCPHKGIDLRGVRPRDGVVVCPGHGLAWNITTGELVRRIQDRT